MQPAREPSAAEDERQLASSEPGSSIQGLDGPRVRIGGMAAAAGGDGYWMHELSYSSLESSDSGYTQQPWLPDELCTDCMLCQQPFGLFRWTHHCRDCGGLYCSECSSHRVESGLKGALLAPPPPRAAAPRRTDLY